MNLLGWLMSIAVLMSLSIGRALAGETATGVATITAGFVTGITVTSGGSGYTSEPAVTLTGGGGSGATAKAILSGDKVALTLVLTAGSGYSTAPTVVVEAPRKPLVELRLELVPKLTVEGFPGSLARIEYKESWTDQWSTWSNVVVSAEGVMLVDMSPGSATRFYRTVVDPVPRARFVWIDLGIFVMGSPKTETGRFPDEFQHTVTLTKGFWISDHEVTQAEYLALMGSNPSHFKGVNLPVENVSWYDAVAYCQKLTERERAAGLIAADLEYRLPTEAEWEYAARAGTTGARYGELDAVAYYKNFGLQTHDVKGKQPNSWGLHDMLGNVCEWCSDWYGDYPSGSVTDPTGPSYSFTRVVRGGSWANDANLVRSASRIDRREAKTKDSVTGFRPVLSSVR